MTVYIDIIFIFNTIINFIIIKTTGFIVSRDTETKKAVLASVITSVFMIVLNCFVFSCVIKYKLIQLIVFGTLMIYITFGKMNMEEYVIRMMVMFLVSYVYGGIIFMIYTDNKIKLYIITAIIITQYIILKAVIKRIRAIKADEKLYKDVVIIKQGQEIRFKGYIDSGNNLYDAITKSMVLIAQKDTLKNQFKGNMEKTLFENGIYAIMYNSIGKNNGLIYAFKPDSVFVIEDGKYIKKNNILIGVYNGILSSQGKFDMLLHKDWNNN
jgi:stage II sporulation protein GA (sporulation sigma-E factor processing peptidase)